MKPFLLTLALLIGLGSVAQAQMSDHHAELPGNAEPSATRVDELTRQMSRQLRLNEAQIIQLRKMNKVKLARLEEIKWQYSQDALQCNARLGELEAQYEAECSRILTPSQLSLFRNEQHHETKPMTPVNEGGLG